MFSRVKQCAAASAALAIVNSDAVSADKMMRGSVLAADAGVTNGSHDAETCSIGGAKSGLGLRADEKEDEQVPQPEALVLKNGTTVILSVIEAGQVRKFMGLMIPQKKDGVTTLYPCIIVDLSTSVTGKHGHAKVKFTGIDVNTASKYEWVESAVHEMQTFPVPEQ